MIIHKTKDDEREIIPDGGTVRVSILAMDSTQKQIAALDERVRDNIAANQFTLDRMRRNADKAQAWADHFSEQRQVDETPYGQYCTGLKNAHQEAV